jgi:branched-chain amino acid transport system substrate-binding protein
MNFAVAAIRHGGPDRRAIRDALGQLRDIPSVIFGKATFDPATRRVLGAKNAELVVKNGRFQVWDGKKGS